MCLPASQGPAVRAGSLNSETCYPLQELLCSPLLLVTPLFMFCLVPFLWQEVSLLYHHKKICGGDLASPGNTALVLVSILQRLLTHAPGL